MSTFTHLDCISSLKGLGYLPPRARFNFDSWITNFLPKERILAECIASRFLYITEDQGEAMFLESIHNLSSQIEYLNPPHGGSKYQTWKTFLSNLLVTRVTGEFPNDTDSGFQFQRWARTLAGIDESNIVSPEEALALCVRAARPILLVDDFLGSGDQIMQFWQRKYAGTSFKDIFQPLSNPVAFYCPLMATTYGCDNASQECLGLRIVPVHKLDERYSLQNPDSVVWKGEFGQNEIDDFLDVTFSRAAFEYPDYKFGYHDLGLAVGLWNNIPDASVQIIWDESPTWKPLIKRA